MEGEPRTQQDAQENDKFGLKENVLTNDPQKTFDVKAAKRDLEVKRCNRRIYLLTPIFIAHCPLPGQGWEQRRHTGNSSV